MVNMLCIVYPWQVRLRPGDALLPRFTTLLLLFLVGIVEPPDDDLTPSLPAEFFGGRLDLRREQGQTGGALDRFHCRCQPGGQICTISSSAPVNQTRATSRRDPPGTLNSVNGVLSGMTLLGSTNAPMATSLPMGPLTGRPDEGPGAKPPGLPRAARTTLAKWVGTEIAGGLPITS